MRKCKTIFFLFKLIRRVDWKLLVLDKCTVKKQDTYQFWTNIPSRNKKHTSMELNTPSNYTTSFTKFFYIFNFLTLTFYFFLIFFYLIVEIESYFLQLSISIIVITSVLYQILILNEWVFYLISFAVEQGGNTYDYWSIWSWSMHQFFLFFWLFCRKVLWWWEMLFILEGQLPCFHYNSYYNCFFFFFRSVYFNKILFILDSSFFLVYFYLGSVVC